MTLRTYAVLEWADGEFKFQLLGDQIEELQQVCDAGFAVIFQRVALGAWKLGDLYHTIRLGLIGGGMDPVMAKRKCDTYVLAMGAGPLAANGPSSPEAMARVILSAAMVGIETLEPDQQGEARAGESPAGSTSPSTAQPS